MDDISTEVRRYLSHLRRYWWVLVLGAIAGVVAWGVVSRGADGVAVGRVRVTLLAERWPGVSNTAAPGTLFGEDPDTLAVDVARVSATEALIDLAAGTEVTPDDVAFSLDGRRVLVDIRADLKSSTTVGEHLAQRLNELRIADILQPITAANRALSSRLDSLTSQITAVASDSDRAALESEAAQLSTDLGVLQVAADTAPTEVSTEIVKYESFAASSRSDSRSLPMAVVFAVSGFALGGVFVVLWSVLDRRVMSRRDLEAITGPSSLLAVLSSTPSSEEVLAAAAAIAQLQILDPNLALVGLGDTSALQAMEALSDATGLPATNLEGLLNGPAPSVCIVVVPVGKVTDRELERVHFVLNRAGVQAVRPILCEARRSLDALD
jgi:hypothetical protein